MIPQLIKQLLTESNIGFVGEVFTLRSDEYGENRGKITTLDGVALVPEDNRLLSGVEFVSSFNPNNTRNHLVTRIERWTLHVCKRQISSSQAMVEGYFSGKKSKIETANGEISVNCEVSGSSRISESFISVNLEFVLTFNSNCLCCL